MKWFTCALLFVPLTAAEKKTHAYVSLQADPLGKNIMDQNKFLTFFIAQKFFIAHESAHLHVVPVVAQKLL